MIIEYEPTEYNFPNLVIEKKLRNGAFVGYRMTAKEGCVFYDTRANDTEYNPETGEEIPIKNYFKERFLTANTDFENFPFAAEKISEIDSNKIY